MNYRAPLLGLLAILVLGVAFWFLAYQPLLEEQEEYEAETAQLQTQASGLRAEIAELRRVEENQLEIQAELALLEEYIPTGVAQPTALREFQMAADAAGVEIENLSFGLPVAVEDGPDTGDPETTLAEIAVTMSVEGGYFQLVDLLRRLEVDVPRAMLVETVTVSESSDGFPTLLTSWSGRTFAVVDIAATADPAEADPADPDADPEADPDADVEVEEDAS